LFVSPSVWPATNILAKPKSEIFGFMSLSSKTLLTLQESRCAFCNKSLESTSHLFIHCHFTWNIWIKLLANRGVCSVFPKSVDDMCYQWSSMVKGEQQNLSWELLFSCVVWNL
jgi:hypothetical protein